MRKGLSLSTAPGSCLGVWSWRCFSFHAVSVETPEKCPSYSLMRTSPEVFNYIMIKSSRSLSCLICSGGNFKNQACFNFPFEIFCQSFILYISFQIPLSGFLPLYNPSGLLFYKVLFYKMYYLKHSFDDRTAHKLSLMVSHSCQ